MKKRKRKKEVHAHKLSTRYNHRTAQLSKRTFISKTKRTPRRREQGVFRETIMQIDKARAIKVEKTVVIAALSRNDH